MNETDRVRLELLGVTYNQIESGVYALILQECGTNIRIPIIIGYPEAQAIECKLQEVVTPRPLTHDLAVSIMSSFGLSLKEVEIFRLPNGVFAANMVVTNGHTTNVIDARSSDAIAMAIRVGAPIYTTRSLVDETGLSAGSKPDGNQTDPDPIAAEPAESNLGRLSIDQLTARMNTAVANENYEQAALIKSEIERRRNSADISPINNNTGNNGDD